MRFQKAILTFNLRASNPPIHIINITTTFDWLRQTFLSTQIPVFMTIEPLCFVLIKIYVIYTKFLVAPTEEAVCRGGTTHRIRRAACSTAVYLFHGAHVAIVYTHNTY